jgi:two-component system nitrate/nitrite response regulator NarL
VQQTEQAGGTMLISQLSSRRERSYWLIAYAGSGPSVRAALGRLCANRSEFRFCGQATSTSELLRKLSLTPPDIVLLDDALLKRVGLGELAQFHRALPSTRALLISDSLEPSTVFAALRQGTWGVLPRMRVALELERALKAVVGGEFWLSRRQLVGLVTFTNADSNEDFAELTPRENAVARRALLGQSNKQIANALNIAEHTVKIHVHHIYTKLHVHGRVELLIHYRRRDSAFYQRTQQPDVQQGESADFTEPPFRRRIILPHTP